METAPPEAAIAVLAGLFCFTKRPWHRQPLSLSFPQQFRGQGRSRQLRIKEFGSDATLVRAADPINKRRL